MYLYVYSVWFADHQRGRMPGENHQRRPARRPEDRTWYTAHHRRSAGHTCGHGQGMVHTQVTPLRHVHCLPGAECL